MGPPKSSSKSSKRWRPTSEQVMILKGLFKGGLTTPTSPQVQKITSQLMQYGKVESKNVFYWFQNHKAREKQKLKRKLHHHNNNNNNNINIPFHYFYFSTQYPSTGFWPIFPPSTTNQAIRDLTRYNVTKEEEAKVDVTWLVTDSDSNHHDHRHESRLKTLELFPTTSSSCSSMSW